MRKARNLVPRSRQAEEVNYGSQQTSSVPNNNFFINPKISNVRLENLKSWTGGRTMIRIWPKMDPDAPGEALLNGRQTRDGDSGLSGMSASPFLDVAAYVGVNKSVSALQNVEGDQVSYVIKPNAAREVEGVPYRELPYIALRDTAISLMSGGQNYHSVVWNQSWSPLVTGDLTNRTYKTGPSIPQPTRMAFALCSLYENGSKINLIQEDNSYTKDGRVVEQFVERNGVPIGEAEADPLVVVCLKYSAFTEMLKLVNKEKVNYDGNPMVDPNCMYLYGDPTGIYMEDGTVHGGMFFTFYNSANGAGVHGMSNEKCPDPKNYPHTSAYYNQAAGKGYDVAVSSTTMSPGGELLTASMNTEQVDNVLNKALFMLKDPHGDVDDQHLIHVPSIEERCGLLAKAYRGVPGFLKACWVNHPEYLSYDEVARITQNRTQVQAPASNVPPAAPAPVAPAPVAPAPVAPAPAAPAPVAPAPVASAPVAPAPAVPAAEPVPASPAPVGYAPDSSELDSMLSEFEKDFQVQVTATGSTTPEAFTAPLAEATSSTAEGSNEPWFDDDVGSQDNELQQSIANAKALGRSANRKSN